jgi:hypothetical protein
MMGSATLLYWHTDLSSLGSCGGDALLVALTPHANKVELLRKTSRGDISVEPLVPASSSCTPSPVQMAVTDVDGDGLDDVVVMDSGDCGNWYALQGDACRFSAHSWSEAFPPIAAMPWMAAWSDPSSGRRRLLAASYGNVGIMEHAAGDSRWHALAPPPIVNDDVIGQTDASDVAVFMQDPIAANDAILFQEGNGAAALVAIVEQPTTMATTLASSVPFGQERLQYLQPFQDLDQLKIVTDPTCGQFGLGFGAFAPSVGTVPRRLQLIRFDQTGYSTAELRKDDGRSLAVTTGEDGAPLVAIVAADATSSARVLSMCSVNACSTLTCATATDFPLDPAEDPSSNDALIFIEADSGGVDLISYDGSVATICSGNTAATSCQLVTPTAR